MFIVSLSVKVCLVLNYASESRVNYIIIFTLHHEEHHAQGQEEHRRLTEESQVGPDLEFRRRVKLWVRSRSQRVI